MSSNHTAPAKKPLVNKPLGTQTRGVNPLAFIPVALGCALMEVMLFALFYVVTTFVIPLKVQAGPLENVERIETKVEKDEAEPDLTQTDIGTIPEIMSGFNVERVEDVNVPGVVNPTEAVGILNAPEAPAVSLPPPPGAGGGTGGAPLAADPGAGSTFGSLGGMGGVYMPGGFGGRSAATRTQMVQEGGGNPLSEACVAAGLEWLALHQADDGHWSLHEFDRHAHDAPLPHGKLIRPARQYKDLSGRRNDIAGTAFGLLPFLAAGQTHKPTTDKTARDYSKTVLAGLEYLKRKQGNDGYFGGDMYAHGLATIAMCEAYGLTSDPLLKGSAQKAINYLVSAQDPAGGGWRYGPKQAGDLSVSGWVMMALKSGQMSGLVVPAPTLTKFEKFLDACEVNPTGSDADYGYAYIPDRNGRPTPTMTAVGLLCRQYLGVNPRNPNLLRGIEYLKKAAPPGKSNNLYYEYYATQVFHHMGGETWNFWNTGPNGKDGLRDTLIRRMDSGNTANMPYLKGSWPASGGGHANDGGRIMSTSLSLLSLEVYYRHLPLYRRDLGVVKPMEK